MRDGVRSGERGHLMAGLMAAIAILMIFSAVAFQEWADVLRRDQEAEMMFRAKDIVRAIQRYRKDHGGIGPRKLEDLMEPGPKAQYYLRHLWKDPLVKDGKWGLLFMGPGGAIVDPAAEQEGGGITGLSPIGGGPGGRGAARKAPLSRQGNGEQGTTLAGGDSGLTGPGADNGGPGRLGGVGNAGNSGQLEGLPIAGVKSLCEDKPFRVYNGLTEYKQWLFTYLDLEQRTGAPGQPGQPGQPGSPGQRPGVRTPGQRPGQRPGMPQQPGVGSPLGKGGGTSRPRR